MAQRPGRSDVLPSIAASAARWTWDCNWASKACSLGVTPPWHENKQALDQGQGLHKITLSFKDHGRRRLVRVACQSPRHCLLWYVTVVAWPRQPAVELANRRMNNRKDE